MNLIFDPGFVLTILSLIANMTKTLVGDKAMIETHLSLLDKKRKKKKIPVEEA